MKTLLPFLLAVAFCQAFAQEPMSPYEKGTEDKGSVYDLSRKIDQLILDRLKLSSIRPAGPCSDSVFIRRIYLDLIGALPTAEEVVQFLGDKNPAKRAVWINRLLERNEFADYLGMKWCDLLRVKSEFPVNLWPDAAQAYDHWIRNAIRQNMPVSQFAQELLTANGSNFRSPPVNFYRSAGGRSPQAFARAAALTFMGERTGSWSKSKQDAFAVFFSQIGFKGTQEWKEEILYFKGIESAQNAPAKGVLPDGTKVTLSPDKDPRQVFAHWLISSEHSPFARNAVNRTWYFLFGRGIIHEPDDSRPDNPPSNPELLDWLAHELVSGHYDMKQIYRVILNSATYQRSCITSDPKAVAQFACYPLHPMEAEVLIDVINQLTGGTEEYSSLIPEPTTFLPENQRAMLIPDGSINSAFLELFGRPPRDTGLLSERRDKPTAAPRLYLLNSSSLQAKFNKSEKLRGLFQRGVAPVQMVTQIYLTLLSRYPTEEELKVITAYPVKGEAKGLVVLQDLIWALLNTPEFLYHH